MNYSAVWRAGVFLLLCVGIVPTDRAFAALTFTHAYSAGTSYTSNLFFKESNEKAAIGIFAGPNFSLIYNNPDIVLGATYFGRLALFPNNSSANTYIQNANIILDIPFLEKRYKGLTVKITENMSFTPQLDAFSLSGAQDNTFSREGGAGGGGEERVAGRTNVAAAGGASGSGTTGLYGSRADAFLNNAGINLGYAWSPRVQPNLSYNNQYRHFFQGDFQDSIRHTISFGLGYNVNRSTTVTPSYSYFQTNFIGKSTGDTSGDKIDGHAVNLGVFHTFTPTLSGGIAGGVGFSKQKGAEETDEAGMTEQINSKWNKTFIGSAYLTKTYRNGSVALQGSQTIGDGGGLGAQTTRTRSATASINHTLTAKLGANGALGWAQNDSISGNAFDAAVWLVRAGLNYRFTAWLFGDINYAHIHQKSDGSAVNDLNVDSVFLNLTAVADPWLIYR